MPRRPLFWFVISLLSLAGALYFWRLGDQWEAQKAKSPTATSQPGAKSPTAERKPPASSIFASLHPAVSHATNAVSSKAGNRLAYRLSNTTRTMRQLVRQEHALLLANALLDTTKSLKLAIPPALQAPRDNGSYVVQAHGPVDAAFRTELQNVGATIISYIPNDAYLVRVSDAGAERLEASAQAVVPYAPYYKLDGGLLPLAVDGQPLPAGTGLSLTLFADAEAQTRAALQQMGVTVVGEDTSPFGPVLKVLTQPDALVAVAQMPGVELVARLSARRSANDLDRVTLGVSADPLTTTTNYLGLTGTNVMIEINDSGVDAQNIDLSPRVFGDQPLSLVDTNGHGTHVAGTIAGSGVAGTNGFGIYAIGSVTNASFRGMAPAANLYSIALSDLDGATNGADSDSYLQESAARTNALISNNSWTYDVEDYTVEAASYDAAVRDALPEVPGSQPVLFVFAAGNEGAGDDDGLSGDAESILSPATAKNVITVGAVEEFRNITNNLVTIVANGDGTFSTNITQPFQPPTQSGSLVAAFSGRGNVGIGTEGDFGRFKPDVVAPGTFIVSDRSGQMDTNAYYHPLEDTFLPFPSQPVPLNSLTWLSLFDIPTNTIEVIVTAVPDPSSPVQSTNIPIYLQWSGLPSLPNNYAFLGTNVVTLTTNSATLEQNLGGTLYVSIGNSSTQQIIVDAEVELVTVDEDPLLIFQETNLDNALAPHYRYESGTSMAAAGVSGTLALMQEFFEQRLHMTNSPALMKALLINGARSLGSPYDFQVQNSINYQGWGLPNLPNSVPGALSNLITSAAGPQGMALYDQSPTNVLATGQSQTYLVNLTNGQAQGESQPLRVTLVWTDPPGNPAAGMKLVNNLDLIVTNLDTGDTFFGNDIPTQSTFNEAWDTNNPPNIDLVNNVQNVYLQPPLGSRYAVTVQGTRVNVNAVTANTNAVVQDFALVISSGDGAQIANAFTVTSVTPITPVLATNVPAFVQVVSNGVALFNQRVGGNFQAYEPGGLSTNGVVSQWNFYVFTNSTGFTNVAFVTFLPPELGTPRMGTEVTDPDNISGQVNSSTDATRPEADIDLYAWTGSTLTNLDPIAISNSVASGMASRGRGGSEEVILTNSPVNQIYYIGVKSEDQQGAQYSFVAVATLLPFNVPGPGGSTALQMIPISPGQGLPNPIPDGSPSLPGQALFLGLSEAGSRVQRVVVSDDILHQHFPDLIGTLIHVQRNSVLNNHTPSDNNQLDQVFVYDDSGQGDIPDSRKTDPPGTLNNFIGDTMGNGAWLFSMVDDALTATGRVNSVSVDLYPQAGAGVAITNTLGGFDSIIEFADVPPNATNMTVSVSDNPALPLEIFVRRNQLPTTTIYDKSTTTAAGGGSLTLSKFDSPPLNAGPYFIEIFNPNPTTVSVNILITFGLDIAPVAQATFYSDALVPILDDAVSYGTNVVSANNTIQSVNVGVRIDHPRVSDLVLTLVSPNGTRVLLAENRGGATTNGYGYGYNTTNLYPTTVAGTYKATTNMLALSPGQTSGTLIMGYNMYTEPDEMQVYYDNVLLYDTGMVSGSNSFQLDFGPGFQNFLTIVMNPTNNPDTNDLWEYWPTIITRDTVYATFTEDTNLTEMPIKFAVPPFGTASNIGTNVFSSDFETNLPGDYFAPSPPFVDGWSVLTNKVTVVANGNAYYPNAIPPGVTANTGVQALNMRNGTIENLMLTTAGNGYVLNMAYRRSPALNPVSWWPAEGTPNDIEGLNNGIPVNAVAYAPGEVGRGFDLDGNSSYISVGSSPSLNPTAAITVDAWVFPRTLDEITTPIVSKQGEDLAQQDGYSLEAYGQDAARFVVYLAGFGQVYSPSAPLALNQWNYLAGVYDSANEVVSMYLNGVFVGSTPLFLGIGALQPSGNPLQIGHDLSNPTEFFGGIIDEPAVYDIALDDAQIQDIYLAGALGRAGTLTPPTVCTTPTLNTNASAVVLIDNGPVTTVTGTDGWQNVSVPFLATQNGSELELTFSNNPSGLLVDSLSVTQSTSGNYYLPEEPLSSLVGESAQGNWYLEMLDNRVGATNPQPELISWQLNFVFDTANPYAIPLTHAVPNTNTVQPGEIRYYVVDVPPWATDATNILSNLSGSGSLNLLFNQNVLPTGTNAGDDTLITADVPPSVLLQGGTLPPSTPPLLPGQTYYLGVQNTSATPVNFAIEVDFNIITLTNAIPFNNSITGNPQYYQYDVTNPATTVSFATFNASGNVYLVAHQGTPLPDLSTFDYESLNPGTSDQTIVVTTNSAPVALTAGRWYLGVFNNDTVAVNYTIEAVQSGPPTIIVLTNGIPFNYQAPPGPALGTFFQFNITNNAPAALFELYNLNGNADLTLDRGVLPYAAPFFAGSFNPGTNAEQIVIRTNQIGTNINGAWYLGVPNNESFNVNYTIRAVVSANGLLVSGQPIDTQVTSTTNGTVLTWDSVVGEEYAIQISSNLLSGNWLTIATNIAYSETNSALISPVPVPGTPFLFYRIEQVPQP